MIRVLVLGLIFGVLGIGVSYAQEAPSGLYYGLGAGEGDIDVDAEGVIERRTGASATGVTLGYQLNSYFSLELRANRLTGNQSADWLGGYIRTSLPTDYTMTYILVGGGVSDINTKIGVDLDNIGVDEPVASAGLGVALFGSSNTALTIEAIGHFSDDVVIPFAQIGFQHYFGGRK